MKIKDIIPLSITNRTLAISPCLKKIESKEQAIENKFREVETLVNYDITGDIASCKIIEEDEIGIINLILGYVYNDPRYIPSPVALHVIKSINERISFYAYRYSND